ncbi:UNVERIFIED_CONTAM: putative magnesium transporter NIPA6 [Sesamum latifolium]|uniref:Probable magnesium transporter n=1 Tax=Sesamum latifolium TaxID=2727402 RepID=A0AAW2VSS2_9LAMI
MYRTNLIGFGLAVGSSAFIGSSFIIKKKGLQRAGASGSRASSGGYGYLLEPLWWIGMVTTFLLYTASAIAVVLVLVLYCEPRYGQTNILVYIGICSIIGSLTVMSIKAVGIAIKLTLEGYSQVAHFKSWVFVMVAASCIITQLIYLNKALDTFNTAIVSPIYYALFTSLTILASAIMFKDWSGQSASSIVSVLCGFITVLSGTMVLHITRDPEKQQSAADYSVLSPQISWLVHANGEIWKQNNDDLLPEYVALIHQDHFKKEEKKSTFAVGSIQLHFEASQDYCFIVSYAALSLKTSLPHPRANSSITSSKVMPQPTVPSSGVTGGAPRLVRSHAVRRDLVRDWNFDEEGLEC